MFLSFHYHAQVPEPQTIRVRLLRVYLTDQNKPPLRIVSHRQTVHILYVINPFFHYNGLLTFPFMEKLHLLRFITHHKSEVFS